jgi:arsenate reductase
VGSAGIVAHGLNPKATQVMAEAGVDISLQVSTPITALNLGDWDWLVTVCGDAEEQCPVLPASVVKRHWPLADPAKATGSEAHIDAVFRATRDDLRSRVIQLLEEIEEASIRGRPRSPSKK